MTSGMLFMLGGGGLALSALLGLVAFFVLRRKGRQLEQQIHSEYADGPENR